MMISIIHSISGLPSGSEAYDIYKANSLLGIGIGNYKDYVSRYVQDQYLVLEDEIVFLDQPENGYLKILTEFGGSAFSLFLRLSLAQSVGGLRAWIKKQTDRRVLLFIAPVISWLVSFISPLLFNRPKKPDRTSVPYHIPDLFIKSFKNCS